MEIKPGYYKTRDGRKARVLCVDAPGDFPCVGYVLEFDNLDISVKSWHKNGVFNSSQGTLKSDLIEPWTEPKPKKQITLRRYLIRAINGTYYMTTLTTEDMSTASNFVCLLDEEPLVVEVDE